MPDTSTDYWTAYIAAHGHSVSHRVLAALDVLLEEGAPAFVPVYGVRHYISGHWYDGSGWTMNPADAKAYSTRRDAYMSAGQVGSQYRDPPTTRDAPVSPKDPEPDRRHPALDWWHWRNRQLVVAILPVRLS